MNMFGTGANYILAKSLQATHHHFGLAQQHGGPFTRHLPATSPLVLGVGSGNPTLGRVHLVIFRVVYMITCQICLSRLALLEALNSW